MTIHILKMAVGVEDIAHLARLQEQRREAVRARGEKPIARHLTRNTPRRAEEVLDGGSIYWVVRGYIQARQRILEIQRTNNDEGLPRCALSLDKTLVRTLPRRHRAFQGWRYLEPADVPPDLSGLKRAEADLPPAMLAELRDLGLL